MTPTPEGIRELKDHIRDYAIAADGYKVFGRNVAPSVAMYEAGVNITRIGPSYVHAMNDNGDKLLDFIAAVHGGIHGAELHRLMGAAFASLDLFAVEIGPKQGWRDQELNQCEEDVCQALEANGAMIGEKIAEKIDCEYNGHIKGTLSRLKKIGIIGNERGRGYFLI